MRPRGRPGESPSGAPANLTPCYPTCRRLGRAPSFTAQTSLSRLRCGWEAALGACPLARLVAYPLLDRRVAAVRPILARGPRGPCPVLSYSWATSFSLTLYPPESCPNPRTPNPDNVYICRPSRAVNAKLYGRAKYAKLFRTNYKCTARPT